MGTETFIITYVSMVLVFGILLRFYYLRDIDLLKRLNKGEELTPIAPFFIKYDTSSKTWVLDGEADGIAVGTALLWILAVLVIFAAFVFHFMKNIVDYTYYKFFR